LHGHGNLGVGGGLRSLLQVLGEVQGLRANGAEFLVEHADVTQVFELGGTAGEHVKADEVRVLRGVLVIVGRLRGHWNWHCHIAVIAVAYFRILDRRMGSRRVAGPAGGVAIPLLHR